MEDGEFFGDYDLDGDSQYQTRPGGATTPRGLKKQGPGVTNSPPGLHNDLRGREPSAQHHLILEGSNTITQHSADLRTTETREIESVAYSVDEV
jgi:hypothetical protein